MTKAQKRRVPLRWYPCDRSMLSEKKEEEIFKYSRGPDGVPVALIVRYVGGLERWVGYQFATFRPEAPLAHRLACCLSAKHMSYSSLEEAKKELAAWSQKHTAWT